MISEDSKIIAVDFDGTIVEDMFPEIGKPKVFAFQTLKMLQKDGHRLILWTYRYGRKLNEAVNFCRENGIEFYAVNKSFPEEILNEREASRKISADIFIDDRNLQGFPGWGEVYQKIGNKEQETVNNVKPKKKGFFKFK
ncbi:MAG: hydrolase [Bacteroidetes bacterium]|nr:MAG: hydrolase [Bacteroidota bacterium]